MATPKKTDKEGYDAKYKSQVSPLYKNCSNVAEYSAAFEAKRLAPFHKGGLNQGHVRNVSIQMLLNEIERTQLPRNQITILDTGCGLGELSVYLACLGFKVIGVDISAEACLSSERLAEKIGVQNNCTFLAASLEDISLDNDTIDFAIGFAALHHFIKYDVQPELFRVMKPGAIGLFADSFGENPFYRIFHDKEKMERLGDVVLTKRLLLDFFSPEFSVSLIPTNWFVMLDKLYMKLLPSLGLRKLVRKIGRVHFVLDRIIENRSRLFLFLSGAVVTRIENIGSPR